MKKAYIFFLILYFFIQSCRNDSNHIFNGAKEDSFARDTLLINSILKNVTINAFSNSDSALKFLKTAEKLSLKNNYEEGYAKALFLEGNIRYKRNQYEDALDNYSQAITLAEKNDNILLKAQCLERMASVHLATDDPNLSLKLYYEALPLFEKVHNKQGIAKVYNIIGIYKTDKKQFDTAEIYLKKAIQLNQEINDTYNIIENKGNLGYLYEQSGRTSQAEKIYHELVNELIQMNDSLSLPVIFSNLSSINLKKNNLSEALAYLKRAEDISEPYGDTSLLSLLYLNTGAIYIKMKKPDLASDFLQKSIAYSRAIDATNTEIEALSLSATLDSLSGDYRSAIRKSRQISSLKDTLYLRKIKHNLKVSELQYENEKKKNLIKMQETSLQTSKRERLLYLILFIISLFVAGLISFALILQKRSHHNSQELYEKQLEVNNLEIERIQKVEEINKLKLDQTEETLKIKERELISIALGIEQKNELLNRISNKIEDSIKNESKSISIVELNGIIASIKLQLNKSEEVDLFNQRFALVHQDFFLKLKEKHPGLTKSDLKFCAYLRLHLSTDQIATILNVTAEAIRKSRYRIRKKIGIAPTDSLEDYISKF